MRLLLFALMTYLALGAPAVVAESSTCEAALEQVTAARAAGDTLHYSDTMAAVEGAGCSETALHCAGDVLALAQLDATYLAADGGVSTADLILRAKAGLAYGAPWQLEATLGDLYLEQGRTGGGGVDYSRAAVHFQRALVALGQPAVCGGGSGGSPEDLAGLYQKMSAALLLADPLEVVSTRCAPCEWLFLAGIGGFVPASRPLPITFAPGSAELSAEVRDAIAALVHCLRASGQQRVVLSGHTDPTGGTERNLRLSERRLQNVAAALTSGGFAGEIVIEARGEEEPFKTELGFFPPEDELRLSRRIELREAAGGVAEGCQG